MIKAEELLKLPRLGKDDTFTFGCNRCNQCCRHRSDILLTPLDLFKIAKYLKKSIPEVLQEYCESYEGIHSKIPVVRLRPREYRQTCPFSGKDGCQVYPARPAVCFLFPLGRMTDPGASEFTYFLQNVTCGYKNQTQTVRQWLGEFIEEEPINLFWHSQTIKLTVLLNEIYEEHDIDHDQINMMLPMNLYVLYDLEKDFLPQFRENSTAALKIVEEIAVRLQEKENFS